MLKKELEFDNRELKRSNEYLNKQNNALNAKCYKDANKYKYYNTSLIFLLISSILMMALPNTIIKPLSSIYICDYLAIIVSLVYSLYNFIRALRIE